MARSTVGLLDRLFSFWVSPQEVRAEAMALGYRHQGQILQGARQELKTPKLPMRRVILLQAVVRSQKMDARA